MVKKILVNNNFLNIILEVVKTGKDLLETYAKLEHTVHLAHYY